MCTVRFSDRLSCMHASPLATHAPLAMHAPLPRTPPATYWIINIVGGIIISFIGFNTVFYVVFRLQRLRLYWR